MYLTFLQGHRTLFCSDLLRLCSETNGVFSAGTKAQISYLSWRGVAVADPAFWLAAGRNQILQNPANNKKYRKTPLLIPFFDGKIKKSVQIS